MAKVQIPTLNRIDPQPGPSAGRIDVNVPDGTRAFKQVTDGLSQVGKEVSDYYDSVEKQTAEVESNKVTNDFETWYNNRLYGKGGLTFIDGDPTEAYAQLDKEADEKFNSYTSDENKYSERVKTYVKSNLANKYTSLYNKRLASHGQQYDSFDQSTTDARVNLEKTSAVDSLAFLDPSKPETVAPFEAVIERIKEVRIGRGARVGTARTNEKGELEINNSVKYELAKDLSEATYGAIDNLVAANQLESAKFMFEKYDDYLDPVRKEKLTQALDKANVEDQAFKALSDMEDKAYPEQKKKLKEIKDPRVKQKALEFLDANERQKEHIQMRDSKEVYNTLSEQVQKRMESEDPYVSMVQLENDPVYKRLIDRVTDPKQRKALREMIDNPKESDPEVMSSFMDKIAGGELYGMPAAEFYEEVAGMNNADRTFARNQWVKQNTETEGQVRSRTSNALGAFNRVWETSGLDKKNSKGKPNKTALKEKGELQTKIVEKVGSMGKNMSPADTEALVRQEIAEHVEKKNKEKSGGFFSNIFGSFFGSDTPSDEPVEKPVAPKKKGATAAPIEPKKTKKNWSNLSQKEKDQAFIDFAKAKGRDPKDGKEIQSWLDAR